MGISSPRYMAMKTVPVDSAKTLMVIPIGVDSSIHSFNMTMQARSAPSKLDFNEYFTGPFAFSEYNFVPLWVPYTVAATMSHDRETHPRLPENEAEWDLMYRRIVFEFGVDGNEYYGANPDGTGSVYDPIENVWRLRRDQSTDPNTPNVGYDEVNEETTSGDAQQEPLIHPSAGMSYGPRGIIRVDSDERWLSSDTAYSAFKNFPAFFTQILSSIGVNDIVYSDALHKEYMLNLSGGFLILGVVRYAVPDADASGYAASFSSGTLSIDNNTVVRTFDADQAARNTALNAWMTGDHERINNLVKLDTTKAGDWMRSLLFGGDLNVHGYADTSFIGSMFGNDKPPMSEGDIIFAVKGHATLGSPYSLLPNL